MTDNQQFEDAGPPAEDDQPKIAEQAIVKWFSPKRGYGFVMVADPKNGALSDLFLHVAAVRAARLMVDSQQVLLIERGMTVPKGDQPPRTCVARILKVISNGPIIPVAEPLL